MPALIIFSDLRALAIDIVRRVSGIGLSPRQRVKLTGTRLRSLPAD